jgi:hypothetical protein
VQLCLTLQVLGANIAAGVTYADADAASAAISNTRRRLRSIAPHTRSMRTQVDRADSFAHVMQFRVTPERAHNWLTIL